MNVTNLVRHRKMPLLSTLAVLALAAAASSTPAWSAQKSSASESRGYQTCVQAAGRETRLIRVDSRYFIYQRDGERRYYLNGHAFRRGASEPVKIACDITPNGSHLLGVAVDSGQYAGRLVTPVDVANN